MCRDTSLQKEKKADHHNVCSKMCTESTPESLSIIFLPSRSSDGEEKDFGDYLSETISKNVKGRVDRTKDTGFTKALDAARSLKRNKVKG